ncbi:MAG: T9SS type A sorting domain-containing protein, partial [Phaeodactylibacter sp.]|nr:T9SS type A sorting domain-containing protein [Phaeodactylibacter sp.]
PAEGTYYAEAVAGPGCSSESRTAVTLTRRPTPTANAGPDVTVCTGQPVTLNASASGGSGSGYSFAWNNGLPSIQNPTANPVNNTTFSLTVTDSNGCTDTDEVKVFVNELPTVSVSPVAATCGLSNGSAIASASGGQGLYTYSWSNGQTGPEATGLSSGSISVTVTDGLGCMAASSGTVDNTGGPSIFPMDSQEICAGESATLATGASGGTEPYTFTWDQGLPNGPTQTVSPANTTTYQVSVTDANNCSETTQVTVMANPLPSADAGEDSEICRGNEYLLQASATNGTGEYTFHWNNGLGFGSEKLISPLSLTTYTVTVTDEKGCTDFDQVSIGVNPLPAISITKTDAACGQNNGSAIANASGGAGPYTFLWSNGQTDEMANNLAAGSYSVTITDNNGCATSGTVAISDQAGPIVDIPGVSQICRGDSVNLFAVVLDGNGPYTYNWAGGLGTNMNIRVAPLATTTYSITVSDVNDCAGVAQVTVPVAQRATVNAGPNQSVCEGAEIQLNGQIGGGAVTGTWDALISGGNFTPGPEALDAVFTPPINYTGPITFALMATATAPCPSVLSYMAVDIKPLPTLDISDILCEPGYESYGFMAISNVNDVTFSDGTVTPAGTGVFTVSSIQAGLPVTATAINPVTGCETVAEITAPDCNCQEVVSEPPVSLGDVEVCANEAFPALEVAVGDGETATWYATQTGGTALAENTTSFVPTTPGIYYAARVDVQTLCVSTARVAVMLSTKPLPTADAGSNQAICPGEEAFLQAQEEAGYTYLWSNGAATPSTTVSPQTTQTFTLIVTDDGCSAEDMVTVTVNPAIDGDIVLLNRLDCFGDTDGSLLIDASGGMPPLAYEWPNGSTLAAISGLSAGTYTVTITDQAGCSTSTTYELMEPPALTEASSSVSADTNSLHTGAVNIIVEGGSPPYTYTWVGPGGFQSSQQNLSNVAAGNYFLTVRDSRQCILELGPFMVPIVVGIQEGAEKGAAVQLFPNPTNGRVWISIALPHSSDVQLEAFNPLGERILQLKWKDITEKATELDFSGYPSGIYLIKLAHRKGFIAKRLIVQQN